jgi:site-specific DNA recombinase
MTAPLPWAIYCRVSTDDQAEEGASLDAQRASCLAYAAARGWIVPPDLILVDDGYTGRNTKRPGFQRLLDLLTRREVQGVIAWKLKRLARSTRTTADLLDLLQQTRTEMACVAESWDTTTPMGRAMVGVGAIFAQLESEDNGVQTSAAMRHLRQGGYYVGGSVPAGCRVELVDDGKRRRLVAGDHADTVRQAWGWIIAGDSLRQVGQRLAAAGVPCPTRGQAPARWSPVQVRNLLLSVQVVPLLVDAATQAAVRATLARRATPMRGGAQARPRPAATPSPLRGLLRCPACDAAMVQITATGHGGAYRYFRCSGRTKDRCRQKDLRCEPIERAALAVVAEATAAGGEYQRHLRALLERSRADLSASRGERARLAADRDQLAARIAHLARTGQVGSPSFGLAMDALGKDLASLDDRLAALAGTIAAGEVDGGSLDMVLDEIAGRAARLPDLPADEQGAALRLLADRVAIDGADIVVDLYIPEKSANPGDVTRPGSLKSALWLPGEDSNLRPID